VVIHPTSTRVTKNWPKEKFARLAAYLKDRGYEPVFIPGVKEKEEWEGLGCEVPLFPSLDLLARFLYESGFLIGNDSGLGHIASAVGIPTITICRRKALANMRAPSFHKGIVVTPSSWIPNIGGFRLRDQYWKEFISVGMVQRAFERLTANAEVSAAHSKQNQ
jgi:ADP-heptose:LPS heptosyltransferase